MQNNSVDPQESVKGLLQLPEAALNLLLQKLDPCSLASTAVTCSSLSRAAPATISKVTARCEILKDFESLLAWLQRHSSSLTNLTECSIVNTCADWYGGPMVLTELPCPQLHQLHLQGLTVQLKPADGSPGVLLGCTGLTALELKSCRVVDSAYEESASGSEDSANEDSDDRDSGYADADYGGRPCAAFAALPALCSLTVSHTSYHDEHAYGDEEFFLGNIRSIPKLKHLKLEFFERRNDGGQTDCLTQLSALSNLEQLDLIEVPGCGVPDGFPSQLVKLTHLHVSYLKYASEDQFKHLSSLTALQELSVDLYKMTDAGQMSGIQHLSRLTSLTISGSHIQFDTNTTGSWTHLTALQSLALNCYVQPAALGAFTQLRKLSLHGVRPLADAPPEDLLAAVSGLTQLTELSFFTARAWFLHPKPEVPSTADAFTALTASPNLRSLQLGVGSSNGLEGCTLFRPGTVYPHLTTIDLQYAQEYGGQPVCISERQLRHLCSCCPALKSLNIFLCVDLSPTALLPLLQLCQR